MNQRELLISRMRGLEAEYEAKETELMNEPQRAGLIIPKLNYIADQYEKWEKLLYELDNEDG